MQRLRSLKTPSVNFRSDHIRSYALARESVDQVLDIDRRCQTISEAWRRRPLAVGANDHSNRAERLRCLQLRHYRICCEDSGYPH